MTPFTCSSQKDHGSDSTNDETTEDLKYETVPCADAFLRVNFSNVVEFGDDTGLGLFTLKAIPSVFVHVHQLQQCR